MQHYLFVILVLLSSCTEEQPPKSEPNIPEILSARNLGLAYLEENQLQEAVSQFSKLEQQLPDDPFGSANLALTNLRMGKFSEAEAEAKKALKLQPDDPDLNLILAEIYERSGRLQDVISVLENSLVKHPDHVRSHYKIAQIYTRENQDPKKITGHLKAVLKSDPTNLPARLQCIEMLLQAGNADEALANFEDLRRQLPELPANSDQYYKQALDLMHASKAREALIPVRILHNLLKPTPAYQSGIVQLNGPGGASIGFPLITFRQKFLEQIPEAAALRVQFVDVTTAAGLANLTSSSIAIGDYDGDGNPDLFDAATGKLYRNNRGKFVGASLGDHRSFTSAIFVDYDNDAKLDLFEFGRSSAALFRNSGKEFTDVTKKSGLQLNKPVGKALFLDLDQDGDLDLYAGTQSYRNLSDGSFAPFSLKDQPTSLRDAAFGDFDLDGDVDLCVIDSQGKLIVSSNLRQGVFERMNQPAMVLANATSINVADYDNDGDLDLIVTANGLQFFNNDGAGKFQPDRRTSQLKANQDFHPLVFDFDNDGLLDLFVPDNLQQNQGAGVFKYCGIAVRGGPVAAVDFDSDGDLDLITSDSAGKLQLLRNDGGNLNHWIKVQLSALSAESGKINKFGIGASLQVRAAELDQLRVVSEPVTHFGLGAHDRADVVRAVWPNGVPQNHMLPVANQVLLEKQVLKGSCMFLYAWDGEKFAFVTDVMWRSAIGMPLGIMAGGKTKYAFSDSTNEYLKIPGSRIKPKNGEYVFQLTEELWETPYMDRLKLIAIDHPNTFDIYIDEQFTPPPFPPLKIFTVSNKHEPVSAVDERGNNVLNLIREKDDKYVANLIPTRYQGITERHELVLDAGNLKGNQQVLLYLQGWLFPTDASINYGIAQSQAAKLQPPLLQVRDKTGAWKTVMQFGFPVGKQKTVILDLTGKFLSEDHRVKIVTNMQVYWDRIFLSFDEPQPNFQQTELEPRSADLHYRGFSRLYRKTRYSPQWFDYATVRKQQQWRDLTGNYTRYGEVLPLLLKSDDMYVIINSGDEITVRFDASRLPQLRDGWTRDFLIYIDGWMKDGDLNTASGQTVEPLPFHAMPAYPYDSSESYPQDAEHLKYLQTWNTRKVGSSGKKEFGGPNFQ